MAAAPLERRRHQARADPVALPLGQHRHRGEREHLVAGREPRAAEEDVADDVARRRSRRGTARARARRRRAARRRARPRGDPAPNARSLTTRAASWSSGRSGRTATIDSPHGDDRAGPGVARRLRRRLAQLRPRRDPGAVRRRRRPTPTTPTTSRCRAPRRSPTRGSRTRTSPARGRPPTRRR